MVILFLLLDSYFQNLTNLIYHNMDEIAFRERLRHLIIDHINKTGIDLDTLNDTDIDINLTSFFNTSYSGKDVFKTLPVELSLILLYSLVFIICFFGKSRHFCSYIYIQRCAKCVWSKLLAK